MVYRNKMKYIYKKREHYVIMKTHNKKTYTYGYFKKLDDAISKRDYLMEHDFDVSYALEKRNIDSSPSWDAQHKLQRLAEEYKKTGIIKHNRTVKAL